jgi:hypothetical protein
MSCPRCKSAIVMMDGTTQLGGQRFRCSHCGRRFTRCVKLGAENGDLCDEARDRFDPLVLWPQAGKSDVLPGGLGSVRISL